MIRRLVPLLLVLLTAVPTVADGPVVPGDLWAPQDLPGIHDCPTYEGNRFSWQPTCGGNTGAGLCHTHVCVNKLCFDPRTCADNGTQMSIGVGPNGDAICRAVPTPGNAATATAATPTATITV